MKERSIGLAVVAIVMLAAAAVYVLLNPLKWQLDSPDRERVAETRPLAAAPTAPDDGTEQPADPAARAAARLGLFDVARIDPDGTSVFAGLAAPNETVNVLVDGTIIGTAKADQNGEWVVITDRKIASADPKLSIAYGERAPVPGRLAAADVGNDGKARGALEREPRTVRDVDNRVLRKLGELVDAARRDEDLRRREAAGAATLAQPAAPMSAASAQTGAPPAAKAAGPASPADAAAVAATPAPAGGMPPKPTLASPAPASPETAASGAAALTVPDGSAAAGAPSAVTPPPIPGPAQRSFEIASARGSIGEASGTGVRAASAGETLPVPIRFVYREANFTEQGRAAAVLLLEYLRLKRVASVTLTGHADERGSYDLNMELSAERLKRVERFLREGGYTGELTLMPKGKTEPFAGVDRTRFAQSDLYELDRRVELKVYH